MASREMPSVKIEIDANSGFCFGVVTAIQKAEVELSRTGSLRCLGDIVHNASEVERLRRLGLETITHADLTSLHDTTVLLRAHGEPPSTYDILRKNNIQVIDATCPVVLRLQRRIKEAYDKARAELESGLRKEMPIFLIYGKNGRGRQGEDCVRQCVFFLSVCMAAERQTDGFQMALDDGAAGR